MGSSGTKENLRSTSAGRSRRRQGREKITGEKIKRGDERMAGIRRGHEGHARTAGLLRSRPPKFCSPRRQLRALPNSRPSPLPPPPPLPRTA
eukprot:365741-Chlamydomonas_euryale.AAC.6